MANIDTSSSIFGEHVRMPFGFAPAATHKLAHPDGEVGTSRAAAKHGICMALSSYSTASLEEVAAQRRGNPMAMQVCVYRDRRITQRVVERAEGERACVERLGCGVLTDAVAAAGYKALFVSVDVPMLGRRLNEYRNSFALPAEIQLPNLHEKDMPSVMGEAKGEEASGHDYGESVTRSSCPNEQLQLIVWCDLDASLDWESAIPWLRSITTLQIWLKGVTSPEDVSLAIRHRLDGVVVSNHGGRQLDGQPATLDALRDCAPVAAGKIPIALDGGVRRGSDIFKAIAMGASAVFLGRVPIWGLAVSGSPEGDLPTKAD